MILTATPLAGNWHCTKEHRNCESIEFKAEVTAQTLNQRHQLLRRINQLKPGIKTVRADIRPTPAAQRIKINIASPLNLAGQLNAKLKDAVRQQWNMTDQAQAFGRNIHNITDGLTGLAIVHAQVVL